MSLDEQGLLHNIQVYGYRRLLYKGRRFMKMKNIILENIPIDHDYKNFWHNSCQYWYNHLREYVDRDIQLYQERVL